MAIFSFLIHFPRHLFQVGLEPRLEPQLDNLRFDSMDKTGATEEVPG